MRFTLVLAKALILLIAGGVLLATLGFNVYLMDTQPVVSRVVPDKPPANWLCGRVVNQTYCVQPTTAKLQAYRSLSLLTVFFAVPVLLGFFFIRRFGPSDSDEYF